MNPLKILAKQVIDTMAEDKDSDDFLRNNIQLHEYPEWQSLDHILLILRVKYSEWSFTRA